MSQATPPSALFALPGAELCVHCGFCLEACPTYLALDDENDSPRGRVVLMKAMATGAMSLDDADAQRHLDRCLGCRACETACPSGVPYGHLLETTRAVLTARRPLPAIARAILFVFARPALLGLAMWGARLARATRVPALLGRFGGAPGFAMAMLASTRRRARTEPYVIRNRPGARPHGTVATFRGCVMEGLFTDANRATERALAVNGYVLAEAPGQRCCGALHAHAGDARSARELAKRNIAAFEAGGSQWIAVNSAGCGAMMKEYGHLLAEDPNWHDRAAAFSARVRDVSELLVAAGPVRGAPLNGRATYDAPCHLQHGQRVVEPPLALLGAIPELHLLPLTDSDQCCGSAGIYNLIEPALSDQVLAPKLAHIAATGAALVVTGNPGCLMQIGAGLLRSGSKATAIHPVELLDASYAASR